jgi:hypothetical protein
MTVAPLVSAPLTKNNRAPGAGSEKQLQGEPIVHFVREPGTVALEVSDPDSLFDRETPPAFPHTGPMLNKAVARFLVDSVREDRRKPEVEVTVAFRTSPLRPEEEAGTRSQISNFFANEAELAALERRVNSTEGFSSFRFAIPLLLLAALVAGLLASHPSVLGGPTYITALAYLVLITVVWVMIWDPIEKILFDSYYIRLRIRALNKLARAKITFVHRSAPAADAPPNPD